MSSVVLIVATHPTAFGEKLTGRRCNDSCSWTISTKYYETEVTVKNCLLREDTEDSLANADCEALVLVVQQTGNDESAAAKKWFETKRKENKEAAISLFIVDGVQEGTNSGESDEDALHWCISNGFEHIRVSTTNDEWDRRLDDEEGQGMPRVLEALAAHMWPGCTMKSRPDAEERREESPTAAVEDEPSIDPEEDEDHFEKLLSEMTNAREHLRRLPDKERRDGAASLALKLAQYFGDE